jgi:hypothetical protein
MDVLWSNHMDVNSKAPKVLQQSLKGLGAAIRKARLAVNMRAPPPLLPMRHIRPCPSHAAMGRVSTLSTSVFGTFIAILLAGCSTSSSLLVDPGHYSAYHCDAMPEKLKEIQKRQQELSNLVTRANDGGGGALIGTIAYRADYENAIGEEKVLRRAAAEKNCNLPPPEPAVAPTPAAYGPQPAFQSDQGIH